MSRRALILVLLAGLCFGGEFRMRPDTWGQPVIGSSLDNFFRISPDLYRSEQPTAAQIPDLKKFGIKSVLSLRHYHTDPHAFEGAGIATFEHHMDAGKVTTADLVAALRLIRAAPKPVLIHCWHGSDRTGFVVAGYRMVFMNWTAEQAIDELSQGGFGFHAALYPNIVRTLKVLNVGAVQKAVLGTDAPSPAKAGKSSPSP